MTHGDEPPGKDDPVPDNDQHPLEGGQTEAVDEAQEGGAENPKRVTTDPPA